MISKKNSKPLIQNVAMQRSEHGRESPWVNTESSQLRGLDQASPMCSMKGGDCSLLVVMFCI